MKWTSSFLILFILLQLVSCSGNFPAYSSQFPSAHFSSTAAETPTSTYQKHDREFEIKDFDKESITDKSGYIILGLAGAALTAAAIVLPFVIFK